MNVETVSQSLVTLTVTIPVNTPQAATASPAIALQQAAIEAQNRMRHAGASSVQVTDIEPSLYTGGKLKEAS